MNDEASMTSMERCQWISVETFVKFYVTCIVIRNNIFVIIVMLWTRVLIFTGRKGEFIRKRARDGQSMMIFQYDTERT